MWEEVPGVDDVRTHKKKQKGWLEDGMCEDACEDEAQEKVNI